MGRYANKTPVSIDRSQQEIKNILLRYGAKQFIYAQNEEHDGSVHMMTAFVFNKRQVRLGLKFPSPDAQQFKYTPKGRERSYESMVNEREQVMRQRWRALVLVVKALLEAVESEIMTFEDAFLGFTVLPGGQTVKDWAKGQLDEAYEKGHVPALIAGVIDDTEPKEINAEFEVK